MAVVAAGIHHDTQPTSGGPLSPMSGKGLAFLLFPGNEQYREMVRQRYPGGTEGEVRNPVGRHVFYTYVVEPGINSE